MRITALRASPPKRMYVNHDAHIAISLLTSQLQIKVINEYLAEGGELAKLGAVDRCFLKVPTQIYTIFG